MAHIRPWHVFQVLQSVQALVHPVRLQRLAIQPVNLLVSIHASLKLYIASDHTPLSFSVFERGPLYTTARQLVHALAMHYAAGALFRAGTCRMKRVTQIFSCSLQTNVCFVYWRKAGVMFHTFIFFIILFITSIYIRGRELYMGGHRLAFVSNQAGMCAQVRNLFSLNPVLSFAVIAPMGSCRFGPQNEGKLCSCRKQNFKTDSYRLFVIV